MKKLLSLMSALFLSTAISYAAENVKVMSLEAFDTLNPAKTIDVKVVADAELGKYALYENNILHCEVINVVPPSRGKRNATFTVKLLSIIAEDSTAEVDENWVGGYSKKVLSKEELKNIDKGDLVLSATKSVGNIFVKGFGQGISFAEGVVENGGKKPIRSGIKKVYKDSPFSYVEKGQELSIAKDDIFYLVFKEEK